jgi:hypothetical protein
MILPRFGECPCQPFGAGEKCLMSGVKRRVFSEAFKREAVDRVATCGT